MKRAFGVRDVIFLGCLLAAGLLLTAGIYLYSENGAMIKVTADGTYYGTYPLTEPQRIPIDTADGTNVIVIGDGQAHMEYADCPDGLCMRQGAISRAGQTIICLPHRLVVEVTGAEENEYDTISQ